MIRSLLMSWLIANEVALLALIPGRASFERSQLVQTMLDVLAALFLALFVMVTAGAICASVFMLFFVAM